ncbi:MAG: DUF1211 domain-containing protein [Planctomycetes bacterium]|nr:DUF1211 domain-containing protein [Planctomycetota bacterium]
MHTGRLEAFSDGVIAILITIMVLEMKVPHGEDLAALKPLLPVFGAYVMSFAYLGIYWNNHHHMFQAAERVSGPVLWANLHLLFWLSLIPFATGWMDETHFTPIATALYGFVLLMSGLAWAILQHFLIRCEAHNAKLREAVGRDIKGKVSLVMYAAAIALTGLSRWAAIGIYVAVAIMWFIPDPRIESRLQQGDDPIE